VRCKKITPDTTEIVFGKREQVSFVDHKRSRLRFGRVTDASSFFFMML
jgi:hypothetical protein